MRKKINDTDRSIDARIAKAVAEAVAKATAPLLAKIEEQEKEIMRLKSQINKDSTNLSRPPSTNGFKLLSKG